MMFSLTIILGSSVLGLVVGVLYHWVAYVRATNNRNILYKDGMYVNAEGKLIATKTVIFVDPKTGNQYEGLTKDIK